jgi:hypothetical protein
MSDDLYRIDEARMSHLKVDAMVMQFDTIRYLRTCDDKGLFLARLHDGSFNFCGIQVRESLTVPFNTVILENEGKEVGRVVNIGMTE